MESNTEGWAVGERGTIVRCFKDTWAVAPSPTTRRLYSLSVAGTSDEAWAVGDSGTILHMVRGVWAVDSFRPDPPHVSLYTVTFSSGTNGWAFGHTFSGQAVALHYYDDGTATAEPSMPVAASPGLTCFPNPLPAGRALTIRARPGSKLTISDALGRVLLRKGTGDGTVCWSAPAAPAGCYFVRTEPGPSSVRIVKPAR
jgi:photosystem II stability/assembly factor-like uncharacterized protein